MVSGGFRLGSWDYLKWKHIIPLKNEKEEEEIIAAKVVIYSGEPGTILGYDQNLRLQVEIKMVKNKITK